MSLTITERLRYSGSAYRQHRAHWRKVLGTSRELELAGNGHHNVDGLISELDDGVIVRTYQQFDAHGGERGQTELVGTTALAATLAAWYLGYNDGAGSVRYYTVLDSTDVEEAKDVRLLPALVGTSLEDSVATALDRAVRSLEDSYDLQEFPYDDSEFSGGYEPVDASSLITVITVGESRKTAVSGSRTQVVGWWIHLDAPSSGRCTLRVLGGDAKCDATEFRVFLRIMAKILAGLLDRDDNGESAVSHAVSASLADEPRSVSRGKPVVQENLTIASSFASAVSANYSRVAIVEGRRSVTYGELDRCAEDIASSLIERYCLRTGNSIGVIVEPTVDCVATLLACLRARITYVPIEPGTPEKRIAEICDDANIAMLVTTGGVGDGDYYGLFDLGISVISINSLLRTHTKGRRLSADISVTDTAYIIYTSGSTGRPKGVKISQFSVANYARWFVSYCDISYADKMILVSSLAFDLGYSVLFGALTSGACLHLVSKAQYQNVSNLLSYVSDNSITVMKTTPSLLSLIVEEIPAKRAALRWLRSVVVGGERLRVDDIERMLEDLPNVRVINHYGPTETTIGTLATYYAQRRDLFLSGRSIVGEPVDGNTIVIANYRGVLQPVGAAGELLVAGAGVFQGYVNDQDLTASSFVSIVVDEGTSTRFYRTGDQARILPDGCVEFLGRLDEQVKVRGYRVDLNEVSRALRDCDAVKDGVVVIRSDVGTAQLVAFCQYNGIADEVGVRAYMAEVLPEYMLPSAFVPIDSVPLNANGKVDEKRLPAVKISPGADSYRAPSNEIEKVMVDLWQEVLGVDCKVGVDDKFVGLGGDSIQAMQLAGRLRSRGIRIEVADIFELETIRKLADYARGECDTVDESDLARGRVPTTPVMYRWMSRVGFWDHWNQAFAFFVSGDVDGAVIYRVFERLIEHHDMLKARTVVDNDEGGLVIDIIDGANDWSEHFVGHVGKCSAQSQRDAVRAAANDLHRRLRPSEGINVGYCLLEQEESERNILIVAVHHLVVDGVSWRVLRQDLAELLRNPDTPLPAIRTSYATWAEGVLSAERWREEAYYWRGIAQYSARAAWSTPTTTVGAAHRTRRTIAGALCAKALGSANEALSTKPNELLLSALLRPLSRIMTAQELDVWIESHGRVAGGTFGDPSGTVGWFTASYPVHLVVHQGCVRDNVISVKESLRSVPSLGTAFNYLRYLTHNDSVPADYVEPEVCFNYLGSWSSNMEGRDVLVPTLLDTGGWRDPDSRLQHDLTFDIIALDGELSISATYSDRFDTRTIDGLLDDIETELDAVVSYCEDPNHSETTASDFPESGLSQSEYEDMLAKIKRVSTDIESVSPLSPFQQTMFRDGSLSPSAVHAYYHSRRFRVCKYLDPEAIERDIEYIAGRHAALRTVIASADDGDQRLLQVVVSSLRPPVQLIDLSEFGEDEAMAQIEACVSEDAMRGFRRLGEPLMRVILFRLASNDYYVVWSNSHLVLDGWSRMTVLRDFLAVQRGAESGGDSEVGQFSDYVRYYESVDNADRAMRYWSEYSAGYVPVSLFADSERIRDLTDLRTVSLQLPEGYVGLLDGVSQATGITVGALFQTAVGLGIADSCSVDDVMVGTVVSDRPAAIRNVSHIVGPLVNVIPYRLRRHPGDTFGTLARRRMRESAEGSRYVYWFDPYADNPDALSVFLAVESYEVDEDVATAFLHGPEVSDVRMTDRVGADLVVFIIPGVPTAVSVQANPMRITSECQSQLLDRVVGYISRVANEGVDWPVSFQDKENL